MLIDDLFFIAIIFIFIHLFHQNGPASTLELDLEHYVVPAPSSSVGVVYAANLTETPRSLVNTGISSKNDASSGSSYDSSKAGVFSLDHSNSQKVLASCNSSPSFQVFHESETYK